MYFEISILLRVAQIKSLFELLLLYLLLAWSRQSGFGPLKLAVVLQRT